LFGRDEGKLPTYVEKKRFLMRVTAGSEKSNSREKTGMTGLGTAKKSREKVGLDQGESRTDAKKKKKRRYRGPCRQGEESVHKTGKKWTEKKQ